MKVMLWSSYLMFRLIILKRFFSITYFSKKTHDELVSPLEMIAIFKGTYFPKRALGYFIHHKDEYNYAY